MQLPWRPPKPLVALAVFLPMLGVLAWLAFSTWTAGQLREERRETLSRMVDEGRAFDALVLLPAPDARSGADAELAARIARELAHPARLAAQERDFGAEARATLARAESLLESEKIRLPELAALLEEPLGILRARRTASSIVERVQAAAALAPPDLERVRQAIEEAADLARGEGTTVRAEVSRRSNAELDRATWSMARFLVAEEKGKPAGPGRVASAVKLVRDRAAESAWLPTPMRDDASDGKDDTGLLPGPGEQIRQVRDALERRDVEGLRRAAVLRPAETWPAAETLALEAHVVAACEALASLGAALAAQESTPPARAAALRSALTCDEALPPDFVLEARLAIARSLSASARAGQPVDAAAAAWLAAPSGDERSAALADLACVAGQSGQGAAAISLGAALAEGSEIRDALTCATAPPGELPPPEFAYPAMPAKPAAVVP